MRAALTVVTVAIVVSGCSTAEAEPGNALDGTAWRLTEIQSMDDAQGATPVPDPAKYTVTFGTDGRAFFQIDCNRGSSTWQAKPGEEGSGELTFGPIATTLMACPPPSLDQRVSTALAGVRSYVIEDGKLHLAMMADSGILTFQPA